MHEAAIKYTSSFRTVIIKNRGLDFLESWNCSEQNIPAYIGPTHVKFSFKTGLVMHENNATTGILGL